MVIGNFRKFPENFGFLNKKLIVCQNKSRNNVNLIIFSRKVIGGNVFFQIRLKESTFGSIFILKFSKLLKFVFFPELVKIEIFNDKKNKKQKTKNKHNSKCIRPILMRFSIFISILQYPKTDTC